MSLDLAQLGAQATEMINSAQPAAESAPVTQTPATTEVAPSTSSATPPSTPSVADPLQSGQPAPTEPTFQLDLGNGRVEALTAAQVKELYNSGLRQADYTRKTQELANQQRLVEQRLQQLNNPEVLLQEAQRRIAAQQPQQPVDPSQPVTMGQLGQIMQQFQTAQQQIRQEAQAYVEDRLQVADYAEDFNSALNNVYTQHPVLKSVPEFEDLLRFKVIQAQPENLDAAVNTLNNFAKEITGKISAVAQAQTQQAAIQRAQLVTQGAEPPGGAIPAQKAPTYTQKSGREVDWKALAEAAKGFGN